MCVSVSVCVSLSVYLLYERVSLRREEQQHWLLLRRRVLQPLLDVPRADVVQRPFGLPFTEGRGRDERMQREREREREREGGGGRGGGERERERERPRKCQRGLVRRGQAVRHEQAREKYTLGPEGELRALRLLGCVRDERRFTTVLVHLGPWAMGSRPASPKGVAPAEGVATAPPLLVLLLLRLLGIVEAGLRSREWSPRTHAQARAHTLRARRRESAVHAQEHGAFARSTWS
jgi:hypothetical protein